MSIKLLLYVLAKRWTYVVVGAVLLIIGIVTYAGGHVYHPTEVSGTVNSVTDVEENGSTYDHSEIKLDGDNNTYTFNRNDFTPTVPNTYLQDAHLWVEDPGSTTIIALQYYDDQTPDSQAQQYTTDLYNHPEHGVANAHNAGIAWGIFGVLFLAFGLLWPIFPWGKKKQKQPAFAVAGYHAPVGVQQGFPQQPQPGFPPQGVYPPQPQPGYPPQQPAYPSQPMYPPQPQQGAYPPPPPQQPQPVYPPQQPDQGGWGQPPRQ